MTLHPCPHCGKTETDRDESTGMTAVEACSYPSSNVACVQCHYCGLSGPLEDTVPLAITAWNSLSAEIRGAMARLCRAVSRRMMPDEPTPEDRIELMEAYSAACALLESCQPNGEVSDTAATGAIEPK